MYKIIILTLFFITPLLSKEVYDCFTFFNELELLKVRLEELYDHVDHFVLVEATQTFCGEPKPLYFAENQALFQQYSDKIIHVVVDDFPPPTSDPAKDRWVREEFQRNAMLRGLEKCSEDDIVLISDLDEIPNPYAMHRIKSFFSYTYPHLVTNENHLICELHMRLFLFRLNCESLMGWNGAVKAAPYHLTKKIKPWNIKILHMYDRTLPKIENAGWHFHAMCGDNQRLLTKLRSSYLYDAEPWVYQIDQFIHWTLSNYRYKIVSIDQTYPKYIRENEDYFRNLGWLNAF